MAQVIDIHTHCSPRQRDDPFGVAAIMRGTPIGKNTLLNYRDLPAIGHWEMTDFEFQQQACIKAGLTGRLMSTPFTAEIVTAESKKPALDIVKYGNDQVAALIAGASPSPIRLWGLGTINPLDQAQIAEGERCLGPLGFKGLLINTSWHGQFIDGEAALAFWEWAEHAQVPLFIHPVRVPIGHDRQMDQYKLDEIVGRPFDTAMALARMILSGLFDRYPRLKICVAHMGGGLLPVMGRLDFAFRLGSEGMPERAKIACRRLPSEYLSLLHVDTMGFWAPHVREVVEVFGPGRVMFGTDYGPVPIDPREHVDIVTGLGLSAADQERILWRNAAAFFDLDVAG